MIDTTTTFNTSQVTPFRDVIPVTPSDTEDLPDGPARCIFAQTEGVVKITTYERQERTIFLYKGYNPILVRRVWATGTAISNIYVGY